MRIFLAGMSPFYKLLTCALKNDFTEYIGEKREFTWERFYALESFFYVRKGNRFMDFLPQFKGFLLDSGAFTFRQSSGKKVDWNAYTEEYADFINYYDIKLFFELDIDTEIGYENVVILRNKLEKLTRKQCIPVWHPNRGKEEFIKICKEYPYVSLGGLVGQKSKGRSYANYFPWFIKTAHHYGAQIHGLGVTGMSFLPKWHFDSVDSTAWTCGGRFGKACKFDGKTLVTYNRGENQRVKTRKTIVNNFCEWTKFAHWAETHL